MNSAQEWELYKLKRLERLRGSTFALADYRAPSDEWDHDHCEGCWKKFQLLEDGEKELRGYCTTFQIVEELDRKPEFVQRAEELGDTVLLKPDSTVWVCSDCFETFRGTLDWKLSSKGPA
jgi:hypothetical protein